LGVTDPDDTTPDTYTGAQLPLFDEPLLYHEVDRPAYFGALVLLPDRTLHTCHHVEEMPEWLRRVDPRHDTFVSQGQFRRPQRQIAALQSIGLVWADCGDNGELGQYGDACAVERILRACDDAGIPLPSLIVASGRGYHAKWLFEKSVPWQALDRWCAVERTIVELLHGPLDADQKATDAARLLRMVGTMNSRTGTVARLVWTNPVNNKPLRYGFDLLADEVLPQLRASHHERRGEAQAQIVTPRAHRAAGHYTIHSLWWKRFCDLRRLFVLRRWTPGYGGVPVGYRDTALFLGSVALCWITPPALWWGEVEALADEFMPSLREREVRAYVGTAYRRLLASVGEGKEERRYRYSTARIVRDLAISRQEMASLEVLADPDLLRTRKREHDRIRDEQARRARGEVMRGTYLATADERAREARRLTAQGLSQRAVAEKLGVSRMVVRYALREEDC
jgi:hypothetical protein